MNNCVPLQWKSIVTFKCTKVIPLTSYTLYFLFNSSRINRGRTKFFLWSNGRQFTRMIHVHSSLLKASTSESAFTANNASGTLVDTDSVILPIPLGNWITGFTDGEGSFSISVWKSSSKIGWKLKPLFSLAVHIKDRAILELMKSHFGGQGEIYKHGKNSLQYVAASKKDLKIIIDHFNKYPLFTEKQADFKLFQMALEIIERKEHLTPEGIQKIVSLRNVMNKELKSDKGAKLKLAFPNIENIKRPLVTDPENLDPNWIAGFVSAEGCFFINIFKNTTKLGETVSLVFKLTQHIRDEKLMRRLMNYFGAGNVYKSRETVYLHITKIEELNEKIIPFFEKYKIVGNKLKDFYDFKKVGELMKNKAHLTSEGLKEIRKIKLGMNKERS